MGIRHSILAVALACAVLTEVLPGAEVPRPARLLTLQQQPAAAADNPVWLQRLQRWVELAAHHRPHHDDADARAMAAWTHADLESVLSDLLALREFSARRGGENADAWKSRVISRGNDVVRIPQLELLFGLTDDEMQVGDWNRILWAGALLHTDIALLVPPEYRGSTGAPASVRFRDGQLDSYEYPVAVHWEMARKLLDASLVPPLAQGRLLVVRPDPSRDQAVLLWYKATVAQLLSSTVSITDARTQVDRGRQLFPEDADLLFFSGCVHEGYTGPDVQNATRSVSLPAGQTLDVGSPRSHLQDAQTFFRKALERNERLTEARVRLGRVLGLLGRHQEAADELRRAAADPGDRRLFYYACLMLGEEERTLGHRDAARDWFERAAAAYPRAQSPLLALSNVALTTGDDRAAVRAIERLRNLPVDDTGQDDPWVDYHFIAGRHAGELFDALMAALPAGVRR